VLRHTTFFRLKTMSLHNNKPYQMNVVHILLGVCSYFGFLCLGHQDQLKQGILLRNKVMCILLRNKTMFKQLPLLTSNTMKQESQQVGKTDQSQHANIRVRLF